MFSNYSEILGSGTFWRQVGNSTLIAVASTLLTVPLAAAAAFVFARFAFPGREIFYTVFTLGLLFPVAVAILPIFIMVRDLGLLDNPLGVALPQAAFGLPLTIVILRPFFASFPNELQDAAAIDGCGPFRFFWRILLPLSRPVLATVSVLAIVNSWNAFLLPLVVLTDAPGWTLPLGVTNYSTQYGADTARILAFTTLSMVPALVFYAFAERHLVARPDHRRGQRLRTRRRLAAQPAARASRSTFHDRAREVGAQLAGLDACALGGAREHPVGLCGRVGRLRVVVGEHEVLGHLRRPEPGHPRAQRERLGAAVDREQRQRLARRRARRWPRAPAPRSRPRWRRWARSAPRAARSRGRGAPRAGTGSTSSAARPGRRSRCGSARSR